MFKTVFIDIQGVLFIGEKLIDGALEFIKHCESKNINVKFLTNNSLISSEEIFNILKKEGIKTIKDNIFSPIRFLVERFKKDNIKTIYAIGSKSFLDEIRSNNITVYCYADHDEAPIHKMKLRDDIEAVLIAQDLDYNYFKATLGARYILEKKNIKLYSIGADPQFPWYKNELIPGCLPLSACVSDASYSQTIVIGKPNVDNFNNVIGVIDKATSLFVGDSLKVDIATASKLGMKSALVLTGVTESIPHNSEFKPTYVAKNLMELVKHI